MAGAAYHNHEVALSINIFYIPSFHTSKTYCASSMDLEMSRNLVPKCVLLICPIFKVETRQSFVCRDGSARCTVRIVAMFEWSKSVICEKKR